MYVLLGSMFTLLALCIVLVIKGPTRWDRLLAMNLISAKVIVIITLFASLYNTAFLLDFAIIYALSGFISTIFFSIFLRRRDE